MFSSGFSPKQLWPVVAMALLIFIGGCGGSFPKYEDGRDTVESFGNGRFQVCEGSPKSYCMIDNQTGKMFAGGIVSWRQQGQFAYIIGMKPLRFYVINISTEQLSLYAVLSKVPSPHQAVFKSMRGKTVKSPHRAG